jgi:RNA polymerase primary sigma factor
MVANMPRRGERRGSGSSESKAEAARADLLRRAAAVLDVEIDFIPNQAFQAADAEQLIPREAYGREVSEVRDGKLPRDLPGHLARLCEAKLLTPDEEVRLFRRMNFAKYMAERTRQEIDPDRPDESAVKAAEDFLAEARGIRDRIVQANMRLVMSIVKKFVTPQNSFDEMLSDGIFSLVQAAEKFDYDRGFRFSTYAYRAIARNAFRQITERQKENARFAANSEEVGFDALDERGSSSMYDEAWERMRGLLAEMMNRLDRRERFIIRSRYALGGHRKVRTFQCLADKLGVSKERVRQLERRAVGKLQAFAAEKELDELIGPALS